MNAGDVRGRHAARAVLAPVVLLLLAMSPVGAEEFAPPPERTAIRRLDTIVREDGRSLRGIIVGSDGAASDQVILRMDTTQVALPRSEVAEIIPRRSSEDVYKEWVEWMRSAFSDRGKAAERARAELALARWCYLPHPELGGDAPDRAAALRHLENAVRLDPSLEEAYGYLVALYAERRPTGDLLEDEAESPGETLELLDREVESYLLARENGHQSVEMNLRLGVLVAERLHGPDRAVPYLEDVLGSPEATPGEKRLARRLISEAFAARGEIAKALALYEEVLAEIDRGSTGDTGHDGGPPDGGPPDGGAPNAPDGGPPDAGAPDAGAPNGGGVAEVPPERFEPLYRMARLRMRRGAPGDLEAARELLLEAQKAQPGYAELLYELAAIDFREREFRAAEKRLTEYLRKRPGDRRAQVDRALVQAVNGRFGIAEKALEEVEGSGGAEAARAGLVRGLVAELRGRPERAVEAYRGIAYPEPGDDGKRPALVRLLTSSALLRAGSLPEAHWEIEELLREKSDDPEVFAACSRLLAEVDSRNGELETAARRLEYAADIESSDAALLERAGLMSLRAGNEARAVAFLSDARKLEPDRPATLNGLGYLHYRQGDVEEAKKHFLQALAALRRLPAGRDFPWAADQKAYATRAIERINDLQQLEIWVDDFDGADGPQVDGWEKVELFGVEIGVRGGEVVFEGTQQNSAEGETTMVLMRAIDAVTFERLAAAVKLGSGRAVPMLRLETPSEGRSASAGIEIFRDLDGRVKARVKTSRGGWEEPEVSEPEPEEEGESRRSRRRLQPVYGGGVPFPDDGRAHTFEIRASEDVRRRSRGRLFDLYLDGRPVAQHLPVPGLGGSEYQASIGGRTDALGNEFSFAVESFRIYRQARGAGR